MIILNKNESLHFMWMEITFLSLITIIFQKNQDDLLQKQEQGMWKI